MLRVIEKLDSLTTKERRFVYGIDENYAKILLFINENCVHEKEIDFWRRRVNYLEIDADVWYSRYILNDIWFW